MMPAYPSRAARPEGSAPVHPNPYLPHPSQSTTKTTGHLCSVGTKTAFAEYQTLITGSMYSVLLLRLKSLTLRPFRWSSGHIGHKNEFKVALLGLKEAHSDIPIHLFTNIEDVDKDIRQHIDAVHVVDLLKEGGLDTIVKETGDLKFGFATKAQSLITGWERGLIPDRVIHLDVDIAIVRSTTVFNLGFAIEPLEVSYSVLGYSSVFIYYWLISPVL